MVLLKIDGALNKFKHQWQKESFQPLLAGIFACKIITAPMLTRKQRKRFKRIGFSLLALFLLAVMVLIAVQWFSYRKAKYTRYPAFGIFIPGGYEVHGIDVSRYQSVIAWEEVKNMQVGKIRMSFAFMKATQGTTSADPQFERNWKKSKKAGLIRGAYHFFQPGRDGKEQAANFIDKVKLEPGDLPPVLDVEQLNGTGAAQLRTEVLEWLQVVEQHYGVKPIIYTNVDFYIRNLGSEFDEYLLWAAHYYQPEEPRISRSWTFWQHSDEGRVNGITSKVDFNVFNGDSLSFRQLLIE